MDFGALGGMGGLGSGGPAGGMGAGGLGAMEGLGGLGGLGALGGLGGTMGMGMGGAPTPEQLQAMLTQMQNPVFRDLMASMVSQPGILDAAAANNPQLRTALNQDPRLRRDHVAGPVCALWLTSWQAHIVWSLGSIAAGQLPGAAQGDAAEPGGAAALAGPGQRAGDAADAAGYAAAAVQRVCAAAGRRRRQRGDQHGRARRRRGLARYGRPGRGRAPAQPGVERPGRRRAGGQSRGAVCLAAAAAAGTPARRVVAPLSCFVFMQKLLLQCVCEMQEMGFSDRSANLAALQQTGGNVSAAVNRLLDS